MQTFKQILVKKGSEISREDRLPMQKGQGAYAFLRKNLIQKGIIVDFVFVEDHEFPSTSSATSVILGQSASGMDTWQQVIDPESMPDEKVIEQFPLIGSTLYLNKQSKGVQATAIMQSSKRIIVQKDSTVSPYDRLPYQKGAEGYAALRKQLIDSGVIVDFKFTEDYEFSSTSSAASVILGQSASGTDSWKSENEPESLGTKVDWTPLIGHMLYLDNIKKDIKATCIVKSAKQFVVKAGSTISQDNRLPYHKGAHKYDALRNQLIKDGIITDFIFVRDYEFSSSSAASAVILGRSSSGLVAWKDESGNRIETILPKINKEVILPDFADEESSD